MSSIGLPYLGPDRDEQGTIDTIPHDKVLAGSTSNVSVVEQKDPVATIFSKTILKSLTSNDPALETAGSIWHAGHALALYLIDHPSIVQGKHVLELGSGCGLVGLLCAALGAKTVVLTDLATQQMHLQRNIELTRDLWNQQCDAVITATLPFGECRSPHLFSAEVLLGADIGYDPSLHEPISRTVAAFLQEIESRDGNEEKNECDSEPNNENGKCGNDDIIVAKSGREINKKSTKVVLLAEEIRWKDVYAWYQEALQDMDTSSPLETGQCKQTRIMLQTTANLHNDNGLGDVVQIPSRKHNPIELTTILRTATDEIVSVNSMQKEYE